MKLRRIHRFHLCFLALALPLQVWAGQENVPPPPPSPRDPLLESLEGADAEKGALAARDLLVQIAEKKPQATQHLEYIRKVLAPERILAVVEGPPVAERIISALRYTAAAGQPLPPEGADLVARLIGMGSDGFRKVTREALAAMARSESKAGPSKTFKAIEAILLAERAPDPPIFDDVSSILWAVNGKDLLKDLVAFLSKGKARPRGELAPYLAIFRDRLNLDLSVEEWERWWAENGENPIEVILETARRQSGLRQSELWRKTLGRIRGAGDPEAYLGLIGDLLEGAGTPEVVLTAVEALGEYPDWLRDGKFPERAGAPAFDEAAKAAFASRALMLLRRMLEDGATGGYTSPKVRRKALASLRTYAGHLEKHPQDEAAISSILLAWLRAVLPGEPGVPNPPPRRFASREDVLELVRTAGALRLPSTRPFLERILRDGEPRGRADIDLQLESIGALGKVLERGVDRGAVDLILKRFRASRDPADRGGKEIRKACVTALNVRVEDGGLRDELRRFFIEVVGDAEDRGSRLPALLGLGTLAKGGDREAASILASILERRAEFDPAETSATVDAIAYLGGKEALETLLQFVDAKDVPFADHIGRKVMSLLKGQGFDRIEWAMRQLLERASREDKPDLAGFVLRISEDPDMSARLSPEGASAASQEELAAFWSAMLAQARAREAMGEEAKALAILAGLNDGIIKDERMRKAKPQGAEELTAEKARLGRLAEVRTEIAREPAPPPAARAQLLLGLLSPSDDPDARWRRLRWTVILLQGLKAGPESAALATDVLAALSASTADAFWKGVAPEVKGSDARARYQKAIETIRDKLKAQPAPAPAKS